MDFSSCKHQQAEILLDSLQRRSGCIEEGEGWSITYVIAKVVGRLSKQGVTISVGEECSSKWQNNIYPQDSRKSASYVPLRKSLQLLRPLTKTIVISTKQSTVWDGCCRSNLLASETRHDRIWQIVSEWFNFIWWTICEGIYCQGLILVLVR